MKISQRKLKQIIKEETQAELNEGAIVDFFKRMFGIRKPTEDNRTYIARIDKAMKNPRFKGHAFPIGKCPTGNYCPEKKCSPLCGKNYADMKAKIKAAAKRSA